MKKWHKAWSEGLETVYDKTMENQPLPLTVFTSPDTGTEYLVVPKTRVYPAGETPFGRQLNTIVLTEYEIVLNGNPVVIAVSEADIPAAVSRFEKPYPDYVNSRFD